GENYEVLMNLNRETRWLSLTQQESPKRVTKDDKVIQTLRLGPAKGMKTSELKRALVKTKEMGLSTLMSCLSGLVETGTVDRLTHGIYCLKPNDPEVEFDEDQLSNCPARLNAVDNQTNGNNNQQGVPVDVQTLSESPNSYVNLDNRTIA